MCGKQLHLTHRDHTKIGQLDSQNVPTISKFFGLHDKKEDQNTVRTEYSL